MFAWHGLKRMAHDKNRILLNLHYEIFSGLYIGIDLSVIQGKWDYITRTVTRIGITSSHPL